MTSLHYIYLKAYSLEENTTKIPKSCSQNFHLSQEKQLCINDVNVIKKKIQETIVIVKISKRKSDFLVYLMK